MINRKQPQTQDKFIVRLPDGMKDQLKAASELNGRTMTAEIVARLRQSLAPEQGGAAIAAPAAPYMAVQPDEPAVTMRVYALESGLQALDEELEKLRNEVRRLTDKLPYG